MSDFADGSDFVCAPRIEFESDTIDLYSRSKTKLYSRGAHNIWLYQILILCVPLE